MPVESIQRALTFRFAESEADFVSVLRLRHVAYAAVGKVDASLPPTCMEDAFDRDAACLMAEHHGRLVGTARLVLPRPGALTEYDDYVSLPPSMDRRHLAVLSRIATHAEYRGGDLLYSLVLRCLARAWKAGRRTVLGGCTEGLFRVYERVGAKRTGLTFAHAALGDTVEQLIYFETSCVVTRIGVIRELWEEVFSTPGPEKL